MAQQEDSLIAIGQRDVAQARQVIAANQLLPKRIATDPWRQIDGQVVYANGEYAQGKDWVGFVGKVLEVQPTGIRIDGGYFFDHKRGEQGDVAFHGVFFVSDYPYPVAENDRVGGGQLLIAKISDDYTYETVIGGTSTIHSLDYGVPCSPPAPTPEQLAAIKEMQEEKQEADKERAEQGQANAVKFLLTIVTNGDASAQCDLAEHYLNGKGVETNKDAAIYWFTQAANQGSIGASNELVKLK